MLTLGYGQIMAPVMAQSIPTARISHPPPPGICLFSKKMLQKPHGGACTFIQIPDLWDKIKIIFNDLSKKNFILVVFSGFYQGF